MRYLTWRVPVIQVQHLAGQLRSVYGARLVTEAADEACREGGARAVQTGRTLTYALWETNTGKE
jgi:hypothetical protein